VSWRVGLRLRGWRRGGAGPGRGPQPGVWHGAEVLLRRWPPSPCRGAVYCGLHLVTEGGGWCWCGAESHTARSSPSSTSASTSGLSRPVLPHRLWLVVGWGGFLSDVIGGVEMCSSTLHIGWGLCDCLCLVLVCGGRYGLGGGFFSSFWDRIWAE
jgi:hypothetical protein